MSVAYDRTTPLVVADETEGATSSVSWAAVIAGAVAAAALTVVLLLLGSGLGLASVSPYGGEGASAATFAVSAGIWLVIVQWLSSAFGGYISGRTRARWASPVHDDEVYFRDTAHGILSWALATLAVVWLMSSGASSLLSGGVQAASTVAGGAATAGVSAAAGNADSGGASGGGATAYFTDMLYRGPANAQSPAAAGGGTEDYRAETVRILGYDAVTGEISDGDKAYLAQLVSRQTGLSEADAEARVNDVVGQIDAAKAKAKEAADDARQAASAASLLLALSMVIGAFVAAVAAVIGGRQRHGIKDIFA
ncbi:hypothetical protein NPA31_015385 [Aurantimonas sp. MSK8Z-1]|uniref:hypothetical protein n=1 Tax=Mangrovibrevibacter kandeliae TaxID=2968473 RepID=UPI00211870F1|nr:hypothetical protein [Aurantimonas sp. MSK8Z-1]MCW4116345.1 hypothetical protein [Aurantimonas sp. MSK8Z-1]